LKQHLILHDLLQNRILDEPHLKGLIDLFTKNLTTLGDVATSSLALYILFTPIAIFIIRSIGLLDVAALQQYVNTNMSTLSNLIESGKYVNNTFVKNLTSNTSIDWHIFTVDFTQNTELNHTFFIFLSNIRRISHNKYSYEWLSRSLPEYIKDLNTFEYLACRFDGSYPTYIHAYSLIGIPPSKINPSIISSYTNYINVMTPSTSLHISTSYIESRLQVLREYFTCIYDEFIFDSCLPHLLSVCVLVSLLLHHPPFISWVKKEPQITILIKLILITTPIILVLLVLIWFTSTAFAWLIIYMAYYTIGSYINYHLEYSFKYIVGGFSLEYPQIYEALNDLFNCILLTFSDLQEILALPLYTDGKIFLSDVLALFCIFLTIIFFLVYFKRSVLLIGLELLFYIIIGIYIVSWAQTIAIVAILGFMLKVASYWPKFFFLLVFMISNIVLPKEVIIMGLISLWFNIGVHNLPNWMKVFYREHFIFTDNVIKSVGRTAKSIVNLINFVYKAQSKFDKRYTDACTLFIYIIGLHYLLNTSVILWTPIILFVLITFFW
jgi:hypothetical protein